MAKKKSKASKKPKPAPKAKAKAKAKVAAKPAPKATAPRKTAGSANLAFNHAMVYARDVEKSLPFYRDVLGMKVLDEFRYEGKCVYARMLAPGGQGTIALHQSGPGASVTADGVRLYFEIEDLDNFCQQVKRKGIYFSQLPQMMPWGWRHAYLNDYDGHEISLYWAGPNRMKKTVMSAGNKAKRNA